MQAPIQYFFSEVLLRTAEMTQGEEEEHVL